MYSTHNSRSSPDLPGFATRINEVLRQVPDKDWNYSRILLEIRPLAQINSPYVLWVEFIDVGQKTAKAELTQLKSEIVWGSRHSDELGFLEIVSLRLNKALLESTSEELWQDQRPVVRAVKKQELDKQGFAEAFWYRIEEVGGEDFDNR
jgi:hypothetical protein